MTSAADAHQTVPTEPGTSLLSPGSAGPSRRAPRSDPRSDVCAVRLEIGNVDVVLAIDDSHVHARSAIGPLHGCLLAPGTVVRDFAPATNVGCLVRVSRKRKCLQ